MIWRRLQNPGAIAWKRIRPTTLEANAALRSIVRR